MFSSELDWLLRQKQDVFKTLSVFRSAFLEAITLGKRWLLSSLSDFSGALLAKKINKYCHGWE